MPQQANTLIEHICIKFKKTMHDISDLGRMNIQKRKYMMQLVWK